MSVVVLGDTQAVAVAGYVAGMSGRRVHLVRPDAPPFREVEVGPEVHAVEVVGAAQVPPGPIEALVVVAESRVLADLLQPLAPRLTGTRILLAPGGFGGVLRVRAWFQEWGLPEPQVAEATGFPVSGRVVGERLSVHSIKRTLPVAGVDETATAALHDYFVALLPELVPSDLTTTSLSNTNHMIHPGVVLANLSRVDNGEAFTLYRSGVSPAVGRLLTAVDQERVELVDRLGGRAAGVRDWMQDFYAAGGMSGEDIGECLLSYDAFGLVPAPVRLDYRYLVDDVPFGLAQWARLADSVGVDVPHMRSLLTLLRAIAPELDLGADEQAAHLFTQFLASHQGVPA
ncbi:NAD/NADP octopine/nopaline dehydrogenase family protein [Ornithinimicrobium cavernae]|uniref:NAD/NADP octopine/nopaline dehydrogenase family protein n=1 Tax=Ornithinimicrobium cavernae TaxID=2666047 RepID=UPI000D695BD2|nr:NAD/NADP octopine/nopaline dehydrogenase family protein [Ornithinimicrobium cavernae]